MHQHRHASVLFLLLAAAACTDVGPSAPNTLQVPSAPARSADGLRCDLAPIFGLTIVYEGVAYAHTYTVTSRSGTSFSAVGDFGVAGVSEAVTGMFDGTTLEIHSVYMKDGVRFTYDQFPDGYEYTVNGTVDASGNLVGSGFATGQVFEPGSVTGTGIVTCTDITPPMLAVPSDVVAEATGPLTSVTFATSAADDVDGIVAVTCSQPSGSGFPVGSTTVICTAVDAAGNSAIGSFVVEITDTTPPTLQLPADIRAIATSSAGAVVTYGSSATDIVDGSVTVSCTPASGSTFPIGTTTVQCSAMDAQGNAATGSFHITVVSSIAVLIDQLTHCITSLNLPATVKARLLSYVQQIPTVVAGLTPQQKLVGISAAQGVITVVRALPRGSIPPAERNCIIEVATQIIAILKE
jgi:hypothetical protein